jgi:polysaccharide deacetylase 2 family uncharacterized protein YibQ
MLLGLITAAIAAVYLGPRDPNVGEPHALATIAPAAPPQVPAPHTAHPPPASGIEQAAGDGDVRQTEESSGVKVTRRGEGGTARIIHVEPPSGVRLTSAPDRRVSEKGPYGLLPKIGADGARPMDVYARPFVTSTTMPPGAPRVALVVGGLGLNGGSTLDAIEQLPEGVTLAFAPYGAELDRLAQQARARGHETLLQIPMEPFDYPRSSPGHPRSSPGPHTLTTASADGGRDDLLWLMSRFTGYAGVMNYLGGRFTADEAAMYGALGEISQRGLFYLDDGASPQSRASGVARRLGAPFAQVDVSLEAGDKIQGLDAALARLETLAREKGSAIGFVNATPAAITRLARYSRDLERRGVALAPVSALAARGAGAVQGRK